MASRKRNVGREILDGLRKLKRGRHGRVTNVPDVAGIREKTGLSQARFAALLGVSVRTLQDWEQGRRAPSGAARTLLLIAWRDPGALRAVDCGYKRHRTTILRFVAKQRRPQSESPNSSVTASFNGKSCIRPIGILWSSQDLVDTTPPLRIGCFKRFRADSTNGARGAASIRWNMRGWKWVDWFNNRRLLEPISDIPSAEFETAYYQKQETPALAAWLTANGLRRSRGGSHNERKVAVFRYTLEKCQSTAYLIVALILISASFSEALAASFRLLGTLPGGSDSYAYGVSANGSVVVGYANNGWENQAFMWTANGGLSTFGQLNSSQGSAAFGVAGDGSVIVGSREDEAFRWTDADGVTDIGPSFYSSTSARGVSSDGSVIVGNGYSDQSPWRWTIDGGVSLIGGMSISANAVSADGSVIVGERRVTNMANEPYAWDIINGVRGLGKLASPSPGTGGAARAVSADGTVVVGLSEGQAFRWTSTEGIVGLGFLSMDRTFSVANGVSGDGSRIVGLSYVENYGPYEAFLWTEESGMRRLLDVLAENGATGLSGWKLDEATAISVDGKWVVGRASNAAGHSQAFLASIDMQVVPLPAAFWLFGGALATIGALRRSAKM